MTLLIFFLLRWFVSSPWIDFGFLHLLSFLRCFSCDSCELKPVFKSSRDRFIYLFIYPYYYYYYFRMWEAASVWLHNKYFFALSFYRDSCEVKLLSAVKTHCRFLLESWRPPWLDSLLRSSAWFGFRLIFFFFFCLIDMVLLRVILVRWRFLKL